ncbi:thioredoxin domain-containing protein 12-like [Periplaneta americana]|uniref:thioredoxin domain-containing protein 12-like n=1 Tax=Periplaneta americana TaxID=6978 RepID=UPI0037E9B45B
MLLISHYNFILGSVLVTIITANTHNLGRGFGEQYNWFGLEDGLREARNSNKPLMLIIHKTWCGSCKAFKPVFAASKEIKDLSSDFVMVNVQDDEEPKDEQYSPDGGYIPRILFIEPDGNVRKEFYNEDGNPSYKYYYPNAESVVASMKRVKKALSSQSRVEEEL